MNPRWSFNIRYGIAAYEAGKQVAWDCMAPHEALSIQMYVARNLCHHA